MSTPLHQDIRRPVFGVAAARVVVGDPGQAHRAQGLGRRGVGVLEPAAVELGHERHGQGVVDRPLGHQDIGRAGDAKRAYQAVDALGIIDLALAGLAGGQGHQFGAVQIQVLDLQRIQDAVLSAGVDLAPQAAVGAGQGETCEGQRALGAFQFRVLPKTTGPVLLLCPNNAYPLVFPATFLPLVGPQVQGPYCLQSNSDTLAQIDRVSFHRSDLR